MASKFKPGIPDNFSLNVEPVSDLGDYLDEPSPAPPPPRRTAPPVQPVVIPAAPETVVAPPVAAPPVAPPVRPSNVADFATVEAARNGAAQPESTDSQQERGVRPKAPRREISMTPETLRMSDELLEVIRRGSGQRDTKANELFHALVLLVHEAMDELDPHAIPKRGRWGTPTARAYPLELKNAFLSAVQRKYRDRAQGT